MVVQTIPIPRMSKLMSKSAQALHVREFRVEDDSVPLMIIEPAQFMLQTLLSNAHAQ
ncbi:hypothetical protein GCM10007377_02920 [Galliscardovia ingluviei]|uniref:Uncharacterized protein n=1 Tax=Galliscardovia ingluviei TaxID=1769422 RepID=A0A8J3EV89_9BIFI|nr:hypothetical protein GCM10007377_02920 [Galliscardovia ingluviei]